ncbi:Hypothetical predicted protein [Cloeon dipterum]|uniref:Uncharacterized protein n=1 Tax=Cloeon dipterum TaxID=197152 RepID=A0A8S1DUW9_9INSE|nr:Hypothetical predicted protein [Cloeon dipterum]
MFGPGGQAYGPVSLTSNNGNGAQQYSPEDLGENDGHSQVKTSSYGGGKTQTSVSGSYKGSGSFSAQAQTIDTKRGAQSQVVGGDDGASSSAQAFGGKGQSQSQAVATVLKVKFMQAKQGAILLLKQQVLAKPQAKHK